jgi:hypothetical protein
MTPAQAAALGKLTQQRERRGATQGEFGEGARAAAAAAKAREAAGGGASTAKKAVSRSSRRGVGQFICSQASESRTRTPVGGAQRGGDTPAPRRLRFACDTDDADAGGARASDAPSGAAPDARNIELSLHLDDAEELVQCVLRLAPGAAQLEDELCAQFKHKTSLAEAVQPLLADAALAAAAASAAACGRDGDRRLARHNLQPLLPAAQKLSYLGLWPELLAYMKHRGLNTISTAQVRRWIANAPGELLQRLLAAHGVASFSDLQVDHIVAVKWGGSDHPFNYFVMPRALNASFNSDGACGGANVPAACGCFVAAG